MRLYDNNAYREEFMALVYELLMSDGTNDRANQIISAFDCAPEVEAEPLAPNDPLTLEQLREMVGKPVWIRYINSETGKYHIVRAFGKNSIVFEEYDKEFGPYKSLFLGNYGKNWLAYRQKPESLET